jgi:hypothetical protein
VSKAAPPLFCQKLGSKLATWGIADTSPFSSYVGFMQQRPLKQHFVALDYSLSGHKNFGEALKTLGCLAYEALIYG